MVAREMKVTGAFAFTPETYPDERGFFVSTMQKSALLDTLGLPAFSAAQLSYNRSKRGVVRGIHYTLTPPGCAKYVHCPHGRVLDISVDIRVGSPTFGCHDAVVLDAESGRGVFIPVGVGHATVALEDGSIVSYLLSTEYEASREPALLVTDPALALPIPTDLDLIMSPRDCAGLTLAQAERAGLLPDYETCRTLPMNAVSFP
jgi:epimerase EvaD